MAQLQSKCKTTIELRGVRLPFQRWSRRPSCPSLAAPTAVVLCSAGQLTPTAAPPSPQRSHATGRHHRRAATRGRTVCCSAGAIDELREVKRSKAFGTASQYEAALREAVDSGEWMLCVELLAEARLLQHAITVPTVEGAVLRISEAGQAVKAAQELILLAEVNDSKPSGDTLAQVMQALSREKEAEAARQVMEACAGIICDESSRSYNCLLRAYARADRAEEAVDLFGQLFKADLLEDSAYTTMASMHLRLGDATAADEVLDLRE